MLPEGAEVSITASVGCASAWDGGPDQLIARADRALYEAKRGGRNQTIAA